MNVDFKNYSPEEAAKILGVHFTTVCGWCKNGLINYQDVSEPGSTRPRYLLTEDEVFKIEGLIKEHGVRKCMLYYKKNEKPKKIKEPVNVEVKEISKVMEIGVEKRKLTDDQIVAKVARIREAKELVENLEAELNQAKRELEILNQDLIDSI